MKKSSYLMPSIVIILLVVSCVYIVQGIYTRFYQEPAPLEKEIKENLAVNNEPYKILKTEKSNEVIYNVIDYERNLTYSWSFLKDDRTKPLVNSLEMDINLRLNIDAITHNTNIINEKVAENKLIVSFDYHGELPTKAMVKINVSDKFKNGDKLYLYYYNPELDQIEFMEKNIMVKDGYAEFTIEHCSDYFLTGAVVNEAVGNPKSINYVIIALGAVVFILIAITLKQSKK